MNKSQFIYFYTFYTFYSIVVALFSLIFLIFRGFYIWHRASLSQHSPNEMHYSFWFRDQKSINNWCEKRLQAHFFYCFYHSKIYRAFNPKTIISFLFTSSFSTSLQSKFIFEFKKLLRNSKMSWLLLFAIKNIETFPDVDDEDDVDEYSNQPLNPLD